MNNKTRHYLVVFEDGCIQHKVWGGNASSLRRALEQDGEAPTAILQNVTPQWVKEGKEL